MIYNSVAVNNRNVYTAVTKANDQVDLTFADGTFGNIPSGNFRSYYRTSNGLQYQIVPGDMQDVTVDIPYVNADGQNHTLSFTAKFYLYGPVTSQSIIKTVQVDQFTDLKDTAPKREQRLVVTPNPTDASADDDFEDWGDANEHVERDYEYQRQQFYNLVERGTDAVEGILELAKESEHPRAYEVAGNLIKQVADVTEKLGELQEKMKKLKEVPEHGPKNVTNALFVGSTAELQKMLKDKND